MIDYILRLRAFLRGRKTYLTAAAAALTAFAAWNAGTLTDAEALRVIFEALGFSTLRAGIANTGELK